MSELNCNIHCVLLRDYCVLMYCICVCKKTESKMKWFYILTVNIKVDIYIINEKVMWTRFVRGLYCRLVT